MVITYDYILSHFNMVTIVGINSSLLAIYLHLANMNDFFSYKINVISIPFFQEVIYM